MTMAPRLPRFRTKATAHQTVFQFDVKQTRPDFWTNDIGDFFEEASAVLFKGKRFQTDSSCEYCPDAIAKDGATFIESKASGRSNRIILYKSRIECERKWAENHEAGIVYCVWRHRLWCQKVGTKIEVLEELAKTAHEVLVIPMSVLHLELGKVPPRQINKYGRKSADKGYLMGWRFPVKTFIESYPAIRKVRTLRVNSHKLTITVTQIQEPKPKHNDPF